MSTPPQLMPALPEAAAQTARRLHRRLRERWPKTTFAVATCSRSQTVTVSWTGAPTEPEVRALCRPYCRTAAPSGGTLWASPAGTVCVIEPLARIDLDRRPLPPLRPGSPAALIALSQEGVLAHPTLSATAPQTYVAARHPQTRSATMTPPNSSSLSSLAAGLAARLLLSILSAVVLAAALSAGLVPSVEVVRSALGKDAQAPANAAVIQLGLATMQGNWYWFLLAVIPLALAVLLGAVGLGVSRSSEWLFKLVLAMVAVIAFAPALVA